MAKRHTPKAGGRIAWLHYHDGTSNPILRTGTIWSYAPKGAGLVNAWWVKPDYELPGEETALGLIAVGTASKDPGWTYDPDTGRYARLPGPPKGELYGSAAWQDQAGALTISAAAWHRERAAERTLTLAA